MWKILDPSKIHTPIQLIAMLLLVVLLIVYMLINKKQLSKLKDRRVFKIFSVIFYGLIIIAVLVISYMVYIAYVYNVGREKEQRAIKSAFKYILLYNYQSIENSRNNLDFLQESVSKYAIYENSMILATAFDNLKEYQKSLDVCRKIERVYGGTRELYLCMGHAQHALGMYDSAIKSYQNLIATDSGIIDKEFFSGYAYFNMSAIFTEKSQNNLSRNSIDSAKKNYELANYYFRKSREGKGRIESNSDLNAAMNGQKAFLTKLVFQLPGVVDSSNPSENFKRPILIYKELINKQQNAQYLAEACNNYADYLTNNLEGYSTKMGERFDKSVYDSALLYCKEAIEIFSAANNYKNLGFSFATQGETYTHLNRSALAIESFRAALNNFDRANYHFFDPYLTDCISKLISSSNKRK